MAIQPHDNQTPTQPKPRIANNNSTQLNQQSLTHRDHKSQPIPLIPNQTNSKMTTPNHQQSPHNLKSKKPRNVTNSEHHKSQANIDNPNSQRLRISQQPQSNEQPSRTWLRVTTKTNELAKEWARETNPKTKTKAHQLARITTTSTRKRKNK